MDMLGLTALELGEKIRSREISVAEAVSASLEQINKMEPSLHSFITICEEEAYEDAEFIQDRLDRGEEMSPLAGVPMAVKDNISTRGIKTTCASRLLKDYTPDYDAKAVEQLLYAGAIILGKTNMDEFAMGSTTETSYFGETRNPWNTEHVPGGSSGGSCAAVAAGECFYALGTDTGGSIRQPSSHCGVTGLRPSFGTISRFGLIAYSSSMDQIGPITRTVADCANIMDILVGKDEQDSTSVQHQGLRFSEALMQDIKGMRVALPKEYLALSEGTNFDPEVKEAVLLCAKLLEQEGAVVEEVSVSLMDYAALAYYVIASAEASANLSKFDGVKSGFRSKSFSDINEMYRNTRTKGFGKEAKRRIMLGNFVLSDEYYDDYFMKATQTRALVQQEFARVFKDYDIILGPTAPTTAPKRKLFLKDPLKMYWDDIFTAAASLAGLPALTVPGKLSTKGLPIGIQMVSAYTEDDKLIRCGHVFEQVREFSMSKAMSGERNEIEKTV